MKKIASILAVLLVAMTISLSSMSVVGVGEATAGDGYSTEVECTWADVPPILDGDITIGEYDDATEVYWYFEPTSDHRDDNIYIYFTNDENYLYVCVDLCPDNTSEDGDYVWVAFDEDANDVYEPEPPDTEGLYYLLYGSEFDDLPDPYNATAFGTKPFVWAVGYDGTANYDGDHRIWEMAFPIDSFLHGEMELGDTMKLGMFGYGTLAPEWEYPINITTWDEEDSTNWTELTLAEMPEVVVETGYSAQDVGMMMIGIGVLVFAIMTLWFKDTIMEWIANGEEKKAIIFMGTGLGLSLAGILNYVWGWTSMLGLTP